jgi:antirestriction protein ArdC
MKGNKNMTKSKETLKAFVGEVINEMIHNNDNWVKMFGDENLLPATNAITKNRYKGVNYFMLAATTRDKGYKQNIWATYKQWATVGAQVVKGSKSTTVVHYKPPVYKDKKTGKVFEGRPEDIYSVAKELERVKFPMLSAASVFNVAQVDLSNSSYKVEEKTNTQYSVANIDKFVKDTGVKIIFEDDTSCYYQESKDLINMTPKAKFHDTSDADATQHYYATLFHELTHATKHKSRLDRRAQFQDDAQKSYAYEELVAELGSVLLSQHFNQTKTVRENHAQYLNSWIKALQKDFTFLTSAAQKASAAVEYYLNQQSKQRAA